MRGLCLEIPFEQQSPVEGANLSLEDLASAAARRPSPGTCRPLFTRSRVGTWSRYKRQASVADAKAGGTTEDSRPDLGVRGRERGRFAARAATGPAGRVRDR